MDEFQPRAFDIEGEEEPDDNEPLTGEEYIKRVRWQAKRCPSVVIADIDYSKLKITAPSKTYFTLPPKFPKCKKEYLPKPDWETIFLSEFSELRQKIQYLESNNNNIKSTDSTTTTKLPHINDKRSWYIFCFGNNNNNSNRVSVNEEIEEEEEDDDDEEDGTDTDKEYENDKRKQKQQGNNQTISGSLPTFSLIKRLDHVMVVNLVNYHIEWLEKRNLTKERSYWLYILFIVLEKPIDSDTSSNLRSLLRRLAYFRSKVESIDDPLLPSINILMTIVGKYFGQLEPGDIQTFE